MTKCVVKLPKIVLAALFLLAGMGISNLYAQNSGSSDYEALQDQLKNEYFSVGALLQTVVDYRPERPSGNNGFSVGNARIQVSGELDGRFGYQLQTNMIKSPAVLDANVYYNFTSGFTVKAGFFKSPFSAEFLRGAAVLDFVNRSTAVNQLAPNRQIGLQLGGASGNGRLTYKAGIFNGNGWGGNQNNDNNLLYVGRLAADLGSGSNSAQKLEWGLNGSYEQKDQVGAPDNVRSAFQGEQLLLGSDLRFEQDGLMLSGEFIYARVESDFGTMSNPYGYHLTGGYFVTPQTQLLMRWDSFESDNGTVVTDSETLMAGLNYFPSSFSKIQINYIVPTDEAVEFSQLLVNLQVNF